ncbi:MAG TPA: Fe-S protein assembly co-chaperone HscB [Gammaproteobacteria bacterium]|nr:Fe-S protein assembly co-chaperone HscB [Gammaproteobacteria bacterium]
MSVADLSSNFFALFDLPVSFDIDQQALAARYREAQRAAHPDKFANAAEAERRLSVQMAARINEAYRILKDPLLRGRYLLELKGVELDDTDTAFDSTFLMEQMELRERLAEVERSADPLQALQAMAHELARQQDLLLAQLADLLKAEDEQSLQQAREVTRKLQFFQRLNEEVEALEDELAA